MKSFTRTFKKIRKVTTSSILTKLTKLRRELRKSINENKCSWCECDIEKFRDKNSRTEYLISRLCQDCQDATFKRQTDEKNNQRSNV